MNVKSSENKISLQVTDAISTTASSRPISTISSIDSSYQQPVSLAQQTQVPFTRYGYQAPPIIASPPGVSPSRVNLQIPVLPQSIAPQTSISAAISGASTTATTSTPNMSISYTFNNDPSQMASLSLPTRLALQASIPQPTGTFVQTPATPVSSSFAGLSSLTHPSLSASWDSLLSPESRALLAAKPEFSLPSSSLPTVAHLPSAPAFDATRDTPISSSSTASAAPLSSLTLPSELLSSASTAILQKEQAPKQTIPTLPQVNLLSSPYSLQPWLPITQQQPYLLHQQTEFAPVAYDPVIHSMFDPSLRQALVEQRSKEIQQREGVSPLIARQIAETTIQGETRRISSNEIISYFQRYQTVQTKETQPTSTVTLDPPSRPAPSGLYYPTSNQYPSEWISPTYGKGLTAKLSLFSSDQTASTEQKTPLQASKLSQTEDISSSPSVSTQTPTSLPETEATSSNQEKKELGNRLLSLFRLGASGEESTISNIQFAPKAQPSSSTSVKIQTQLSESQNVFESEQSNQNISTVLNQTGGRNQQTKYTQTSTTKDIGINTEPVIILDSNTKLPEDLQTKSTRNIGTNTEPESSTAQETRLQETPLTEPSLPSINLAETALTNVQIQTGVTESSNLRITTENVSPEEQNLEQEQVLTQPLEQTNRQDVESLSAFAEAIDDGLLNEDQVPLTRQDPSLFGPIPEKYHQAYNTFEAQQYFGLTDFHYDETTKKFDIPKHADENTRAERAQSLFLMTQLAGIDDPRQRMNKILELQGITPEAQPEFWQDALNLGFPPVQKSNDKWIPYGNMPQARQQAISELAELIEKTFLEPSIPANKKIERINELLLSHRASELAGKCDTAQPRRLLEAKLYFGVPSFAYVPQLDIWTPIGDFSPLERTQLESLYDELIDIDTPQARIQHLTHWFSDKPNAPFEIPAQPDFLNEWQKESTNGAPYFKQEKGEWVPIGRMEDEMLANLVGIANKLQTIATPEGRRAYLQEQGHISYPNAAEPSTKTTIEDHPLYWQSLLREHSSTPFLVKVTDATGADKWNVPTNTPRFQMWKGYHSKLASTENDASLIQDTIRSFLPELKRQIVEDGIQPRHWHQIRQINPSVQPLTPYVSSLDNEIRYKLPDEASLATRRAEQNLNRLVSAPFAEYEKALRERGLYVDPANRDQDSLARAADGRNLYWWQEAQQLGAPDLVFNQHHQVWDVDPNAFHQAQFQKLRKELISVATPQQRGEIIQRFIVTTPTLFNQSWDTQPLFWKELHGLGLSLPLLEHIGERWHLPADADQGLKGLLIKLQSEPDAAKRQLIAKRHGYIPNPEFTGNKFANSQFKASMGQETYWWDVVQQSTVHKGQMRLAQTPLGEYKARDAKVQQLLEALLKAKNEMERSVLFTVWTANMEGPKIEPFDVNNRELQELIQSIMQMIEDPQSPNSQEGLISDWKRKYTPKPENTSVTPWSNQPNYWKELHDLGVQLPLLEQISDTWQLPTEIAIQIDGEPNLFRIRLRAMLNELQQEGSTPAQRRLIAKRFGFHPDPEATASDLSQSIEKANKGMSTYFWDVVEEDMAADANLSLIRGEDHQYSTVRQDAASQALFEALVQAPVKAQRLEKYQIWSINEKTAVVPSQQFSFDHPAIKELEGIVAAKQEKTAAVDINDPAIVAWAQKHGVSLSPPLSKEKAPISLDTDPAEVPQSEVQEQDSTIWNTQPSYWRYLHNWGLNLPPLIQIDQKYQLQEEQMDPWQADRVKQLLERLENTAEESEQIKIIKRLGFHPNTEAKGDAYEKSLVLAQQGRSTYYWDTVENFIQNTNLDNLLSNLPTSERLLAGQHFYNLLITKNVNGEYEIIGGGTLLQRQLLDAMQDIPTQQERMQVLKAWAANALGPRYSFEQSNPQVQQAVDLAEKADLTEKGLPQELIEWALQEKAKSESTITAKTPISPSSPVTAKPSYIAAAEQAGLPESQFNAEEQKWQITAKDIPENCKTLLETFIEDEIKPAFEQEILDEERGVEVRRVVDSYKYQIALSLALEPDNQVMKSLAQVLNVQTELAKVPVKPDHMQAAEQAGLPTSEYDENKQQWNIVDQSLSAEVKTELENFIEEVIKPAFEQALSNEDKKQQVQSAINKYKQQLATSLAAAPESIELKSLATALNVKADPALPKTTEKPLYVIAAEAAGIPPFNFDPVTMKWEISDTTIGTREKLKIENFINSEISRAFEQDGTEAEKQDRVQQAIESYKKNIIDRLSRAPDNEHLKAMALALSIPPAVIESRTERSTALEKPEYLALAEEEGLPPFEYNAEADSWEPNKNISNTAVRSTLTKMVKKEIVLSINDPSLSAEAKKSELKIRMNAIRRQAEDLQQQEPENPVYKELSELLKSTWLKTTALRTNVGSDDMDESDDKDIKKDKSKPVPPAPPGPPPPNPVNPSDRVNTKSPSVKQPHFWKVIQDLGIEVADLSPKASLVAKAVIWTVNHKAKGPSVEVLNALYSSICNLTSDEEVLAQARAFGIVPDPAESKDTSKGKAEFSAANSANNLHWFSEAHDRLKDYPNYAKLVRGSDLKWQPSARCNFMRPLVKDLVRAKSGAERQAVIENWLANSENVAKLDGSLYTSPLTDLPSEPETWKYVREKAPFVSKLVKSGSGNIVANPSQDSDLSQEIYQKMADMINAKWDLQNEKRYRSRIEMTLRSLGALPDPEAEDPQKAQEDAQQGADLHWMNEINSLILEPPSLEWQDNGLLGFNASIKHSTQWNRLLSAVQSCDTSAARLTAIHKAIVANPNIFKTKIPLSAEEIGRYRPPIFWSNLMQNLGYKHDDPSNYADDTNEYSLFHLDDQNQWVLKPEGFRYKSIVSALKQLELSHSSSHQNIRKVIRLHGMLPDPEKPNDPTELALAREGKNTYFWQEVVNETRTKPRVTPTLGRPKPIEDSWPEELKYPGMMLQKINPADPYSAFKIPKELKELGDRLIDGLSQIDRKNLVNQRIDEIRKLVDPLKHKYYQDFLDGKLSLKPEQILAKSEADIPSIQTKVSKDSITSKVILDEQADLPQTGIISGPLDDKKDLDFADSSLPDELTKESEEQMDDELSQKSKPSSPIIFGASSDLEPAPSTSRASASSLAPESEKASSPTPSLDTYDYEEEGIDDDEQGEYSYPDYFAEMPDTYAYSRVNFKEQSVQWQNSVLYARLPTLVKHPSRDEAVLSSENRVLGPVKSALEALPIMDPNAITAEETGSIIQTLFEHKLLTIEDTAKLIQEQIADSVFDPNNLPSALVDRVLKTQEPSWRYAVKYLNAPYMIKDKKNSTEVSLPSNLSAAELDFWKNLAKNLEGANNDHKTIITIITNAASILYDADGAQKLIERHQESFTTPLDQSPRQVHQVIWIYKYLKEEAEATKK